ncbi:hypothetical protein M8C21_006996, partial [Ambrosia artemisiifolia]
VHDEDEDESDEENDLVIQEEFSRTCKRCREVINEYYSWGWGCEFCGSYHNKGEVCYDDFCGFHIDVNCAMEGDKRRIYHPCHSHPLVSLLLKPILCECNACGKEHKGFFFQCTTCSTYAIHRDCAFLPKRLLIQQTTNAIFSHTHPLTLSYSFPKKKRVAKYDPTCRICDLNFDYWRNCWIYKCEKCIYYVHLQCAMSKREGRGKTVKNFNDVDYPNLPRLPFPDETHNIGKHLFFNKVGPTAYDTGKLTRKPLGRPPQKSMN